MILTDEEKRMRDGAEGAATAAAMDLLIRYGDALAADLDQDPCAVIRTGDWVRVDATHRLIEVKPAGPARGADPPEPWPLGSWWRRDSGRTARCPGARRGGLSELRDLGVAPALAGFPRSGGVGGVRGAGYADVEADRQPAREEQGSQPAHSHDDAFRGCPFGVHPLSAAALQSR